MLEGHARTALALDPETEEVDPDADGLSLEERIQIVAQECERVIAARADARKRAEQALEQCHAQMEEAELRQQELRRDIVELRRAEAVKLPGAGKESAVAKHAAERTRVRDAHVAKLRGKSAALKLQAAKLDAQVRVRGDGGGDVMFSVDLDQLRIENAQFLEKIDARNRELVGLKRATGSSVLLLNALSAKLARVVADQASLKSELASRSAFLLRLRAEVGTVDAERGKAERRNASLRAAREAVRVPRVEEYIEQRAEERVLVRAKANWERKVAIATGEAGVLARKLRALGIMPTPIPAPPPPPSGTLVGSVTVPPLALTAA